MIFFPNKKMWLQVQSQGQSKSEQPQWASWVLAMLSPSASHSPARRLHRDLVEGSTGSRKEARFLFIKLGCEGTESPMKGPRGWLSVCVNVCVYECVCECVCEVCVCECVCVCVCVSDCVCVCM